LETRGLNVAGLRGISKFAGAKIRDVGKAAGTGSLDIRGVKIAGQSLASATGMKLGEAQKGGFVQMRKDQVEKRQKRAEELKVGEDEASKQRLNAVEDAHQELLVRDGNAHEIELLDKRIKVLGERATVASRQARTYGGTAINPSTGNSYDGDARLAEAALNDANGARLAIKNASMFVTSAGEVLDHRQATTNTNLSEDAVAGIARAAAGALAESTAAAAAAAAAPGNAALAARATAFAHASTIADAASYSAVATQAAALAAANPANAALAAAATTAHADATAAAGAVTALAAANPANANLAHANQAAADALTRIANGFTGRSINNLEDTDIPAEHHNVEHITKERQRLMAGNIESGLGQAVSFISNPAGHSFAGDREAAHKIRMDAKLDSGTGGKGGGH
jgi:hypothetical protein